MLKAREESPGVFSILIFEFFAFLCGHSGC